MDDKIKMHCVKNNNLSRSKLKEKSQKLTNTKTKPWPLRPKSVILRPDKPNSDRQKLTLSTNDWLQILEKLIKISI